MFSLQLCSQGQIQEWGRHLTFQNKEPSPPLSHNHRNPPHQCFVAALQLATGVGLPDGSGLLLRHDLRLPARRSRGRRVQRQLAQSQLTLKSTTLCLALPQVLPSLRKSILKQGSDAICSFGSFVCLFQLFLRSVGQCQVLDTFLGLAGIPAWVTIRLKVGSVVTHSFCLFTSFLLTMESLCWVFSTIRSHWGTCCRSSRQTSKNVFCLIGAGRCWESKHQFGWFLCWPHRRRRGVS